MFIARIGRDAAHVCLYDFFLQLAVLSCWCEIFHGNRKSPFVSERTKHKYVLSDKTEHVFVGPTGAKNKCKMWRKTSVKPRQSCTQWCLGRQTWARLGVGSRENGLHRHGENFLWRDVDTLNINPGNKKFGTLISVRRSLPNLNQLWGIQSIMKELFSFGR